MLPGPRANHTLSSGVIVTRTTIDEITVPCKAPCGPDRGDRLVFDGFTEPRDAEWAGHPVACLASISDGSKVATIVLSRERAIEMIAALREAFHIDAS